MLARANGYGWSWVERIMADALKDIMLKITDDDPATRGQKLWVMFALAVFLVASLNWYAMVREPQVVLVEDLVNHNRETVLVEGTVISWIEDRYGSGEDRVDLVVEDDTGVISVSLVFNWRETPDRDQCHRDGGCGRLQRTILPSINRGWRHLVGFIRFTRSATPHSERFSR